MFEPNLNIKPIKAAFISDLHLQADREALTQQFFRFLDWAEAQVETLYILGDFFHVWAGDDTLDEWAKQIALRLATLSDNGVKCYFMAGNRDFLLGKQFAALAKWQVLPDPYLIKLDKITVLLSHGDRYCTHDKAHQWFRRLTRWAGFKSIFSWVPISLRKSWVQGVRHYSAKHNKTKSMLKMDVVSCEIVKSMKLHHAQVLIHGHTHIPKMVKHEDEKEVYTRYVLSDWDDNPIFLCYYEPYGFKLKPLPLV